MKNKLRNELRNEAAQGMSEYLIIIGLIGIGAVGVATLFADDIRDMFGASSEALSGEDEATRKMGPLNDNVAEHKDLNDYAKNMEGKANGLK